MSQRRCVLTLGLTAALTMGLATAEAQSKRSVTTTDGKSVEYTTYLPRDVDPESPPALILFLGTGPAAPARVQVSGGDGPIDVDIEGLLARAGAGGASVWKEAARAADARGWRSAIVPVAAEATTSETTDLLRAVMADCRRQAAYDAEKVAVVGQGVLGPVALRAAAARPELSAVAAGLDEKFELEALTALAGRHVHLRTGEEHADLDAWREKAATRLRDLKATVDARSSGRSKGTLARLPLLAWLERIWLGRAAPVRMKLRSKDGTSVFGDFYDTGDKKRPVVVLAHDRGSSRGDYAHVAPRLVRAGYNVFAVDLREGGDSSDGTRNETVEHLRRSGRSDRGLDDGMARDLEAACRHVKRKGYRGPLVVWGSGRSADHAVVLAARLKIDGFVLFSPTGKIGEKHRMKRGASRMKSPVFVTVPRQGRDDVQTWFDMMPSKKKELDLRRDGIWGVRALGSGSGDRTFGKVMSFLGRHFE